MSQPPLLVNVTGPVQPGRTIPIAKENFLVPTTKQYFFDTAADAVLVSLYVISVASDIEVTVYTQTDLGKEVLVTTFPVISAPTANLLLRKSVNILSKIKVQVVTTGAAEFEIYARGVSGSEVSARVLGAGSAGASSTTATGVPGIIIPSALTDRAGLILKNYSNAGTLFIGFELAEATTTDGYPIDPKESLGMDISAGVDVYGVSDGGTLDIRLLQAGG